MRTMDLQVQTKACSKAAGIEAEQAAETRAQKFRVMRTSLEGRRTEKGAMESLPEITSRSGHGNRPDVVPALAII